MRFNSRRDYQTMLDLNKELINRVIDTVVTIYKISVQETRTNIYGESTRKEYYRPVRVPCLINRGPTTVISVGNVQSSVQPTEFQFLRKELEAREVYPEAGDIISFHDSYYEILNTNEVQLVAGQVVYNHSIICSCALTTAPATLLQNRNV